MFKHTSQQHCWTHSFQPTRDKNKHKLYWKNKMIPHQEGSIVELPRLLTLKKASLVDAPSVINLSYTLYFENSTLYVRQKDFRLKFIDETSNISEHLMHISLILRVFVPEKPPHA